MKKHVANILRKLWYIAAIFVAIVAIFMTTARLVTPLLNSHISKFEHWTSVVLGVPVKIERVDAWWSGFHPDLEFQNISVLTQDHKNVVLRVKRLQIDISLIHSLMTRYLQPSGITVSGVHLTVHQTALHQFAIRGIGDQTLGQSSSMDNQNLVDWLFARPYLTLEDVQVDWQSWQDKEFSIVIQNLDVKNSNARHVIEGLFQLPGMPDSSARIIFQFGDIHDSKKLSIRAYGLLRHVQLSFWADQLSLKGLSVQSGELNGELWATWEEGRWDSVQSLFDVRALNLLQDKRKLPVIDQASGNLFWETTSSGWQLAIDRFDLQTSILSWKNNQLYFSTEGNARQLRMGHVAVHDLMQLLSYFSWNTWKKKMNALQVSGKLQNLIWQQQGAFNQLSAQFKQLNFKRFQKWPGVLNLSGTLNVQPTAGQVLLSSHNVVLDFGKLFLRPLQLDQLDANVSWHQASDGHWSIMFEQLSGANEHVAIYGNGALSISKDGQTPWLSLLGGYTLDDPRVVKYYLPRTTIHANGFNWLSHAFVGGQGGAGTLVLVGNVNDFPFDQDNGTFVVDSRVNTDFHYAPGWPDILDVTAHLVFSGRSMSCDAESGNLYQAKLVRAHVEIPVMQKDKPLMLYVDSRVEGDASDMLQYLRNSPLQNSFGEDIASATMKGATSVGLNLTIPLEHTQDTDIKGTINFADVQINMPTWEVTLNDLKGDLFFTQKGLLAQSLKGMLFNEPVTLSVETVRDIDPNAITRVKMHGHVLLDDLKQIFHWPELSFVQGQTDYDAVVDLHTAKGDTRQNLLSLSSDLNGIKIDLAPLLSKESEAILPFGLYFRFGGSESPSALTTLGDRMSAALSYHVVQKKWSLFSAHLHFGPGSAVVQNEQGLYVDGGFPQFNWKDWMQAFNNTTTKMPTEEGAQFLQALKKFLRLAHIKFDQADLWGQHLSDVTVDIKPQATAWEMDLDNSQIIGQIVLPDDFPHHALVGRFDRLFLQKMSALPQTTLINPGDMPPLDLAAENFQYGGQSYGASTLMIEPEKDALNIKHFTFDAPLLSGDVSGRFDLLSDKSYMSALSGQVRTDDVTGFLRAMNINTSLLAKQGVMQFQLQWPDSLFKFNIAEAVGSAALALKKGQVINLGDQTNAKLNIGRLLSLLNVNRLLTMKFSDLTQTGYSFDEMKGDFILSAGEITTHNLYFDGQLARIDVKGWMNVAKETLDMNLMITPYLTNSVPLVATIAGGPIVGAAAWVANKLFGKEVDKLKRYYYQVTGLWNKPVIKQLKTNSVDISEAQVAS